MRRTPQDFKRVEVKQIITKVLGDTQTRLLPISITVGESLDDDFTTTDFSFEITGKDPKIVTLEGQKGKGLWMGCSQAYNNISQEYSSLEKIRLADYSVNPIMTNSKNSMGTDAQASVSLSVWFILTAYQSLAIHHVR